MTFVKHIQLKLSFKKGILTITILTILLAGCSRQTPISQENTTPNTKILHTNEEEKTKPALPAQYAKITLLETKPTLEENKLLYGKIQITLPDDVTIEEQAAEQDRSVIDLIGAERIQNKPLPPRIWLAHYHAVYQNEYDLTSALLDVLPDQQLSVPLCIQYKTNDNRHYLFTFRMDYCKQGYVLVYEDDIYIFEELDAEQDYSFRKLLDEGAVRWEDNICEIGDRCSEEYCTVYNKIKAEEDYSFLVVQSVDKNDVRTVFLFRDGYFTAPGSIFSFKDVSWIVAFEDYNFDGCPDMIVPSPFLVYLWNPDKKTYEEVQMPEGFRPSVGSIKCFPETKTIYREEFDNDKNKEENWDRYYRTETLWQWEENTLIKKRECIVEKSDEDVRILAYENNAQSQNILFDETVSISDWDKNSEKVQTCYQKFYAGMLPEKNNEWLHPVDYNSEHREYIPQAFLDKIAKAMINDTVPETRREFTIDNKLTSEEMASVSKNNLALRCDLLEGEWIKNYIMTMADVDNDGIDDIIVKKYYDNAYNFSDYDFFQGQKDGMYQRTSSYSSVGERFDVLSYDGKNYLCRTLCRTPFGYGLNEHISIVCYVDGIAAETVDLFFVPKEDNARPAECADVIYEVYQERSNM